jgi:hypothetical protein
MVVSAAAVPAWFARSVRPMATVAGRGCSSSAAMACCPGRERSSTSATSPPGSAPSAPCPACAAPAGHLHLRLRGASDAARQGAGATCGTVPDR